MAELLFPELGIGAPTTPLRQSFGGKQVFGGGGHGGNVKAAAAS